MQAPYVFYYNLFCISIYFYNFSTYFKGISIGWVDNLFVLLNKNTKYGFILIKTLDNHNI